MLVKPLLFAATFLREDVGIIPNNTSGFDDAGKTPRVFYENEILPLLARLEELNEWAGERGWGLGSMRWRLRLPESAFPLANPRNCGDFSYEIGKSDSYIFRQLLIHRIDDKFLFKY
ncbi:hypothetical protein [Chromobacterium vaccinii]|uniref:hypothetical protein n=1 Tax=Chromobacterium vaccinii TaxID=1108595 RepID=UPI00061821D3|nr:hypothetical protein [Chromobacterium vaccinii]